MISKKDEQIDNEELDELQEEIDSINDSELQNETKDNEFDNLNNQIADLKESLARKQADYVNFKNRVERDQSDMINFMTSKIISKFLPHIDNLDRIIDNTLEENKKTALFEGISALEKSMKKELEGFGVKSFDSIGEVVNIDKHEVMAQAPGKEGIIVSEFEKGYTLNDKILRHAKVVVGKE